jgi:hypothetical protein
MKCNRKRKQKTIGKSVIIEFDKNNNEGGETLWLKNSIQQNGGHFNTCQ